MSQLVKMWRCMILLWVVSTSMIVAFTNNTNSIWIIGVICLIVGTIASFMYNTSKNL